MALRQLSERGNIPESGGSLRSLLALGRRFGRLLKKPAHAWIIYVVAASLEYEDSCTQRLEAIGMSLGQGVTWLAVREDVGRPDRDRTSWLAESSVSVRIMWGELLIRNRSKFIGIVCSRMKNSGCYLPVLKGIIIPVCPYEGSVRSTHLKNQCEYVTWPERIFLGKKDRWRAIYPGNQCFRYCSM